MMGCTVYLCMWIFTYTYRPVFVRAFPHVCACVSTSGLVEFVGVWSCKLLMSHSFQQLLRIHYSSNSVVVDCRKFSRAHTLAFQILLYFFSYLSVHLCQLACGCSLSANIVISFISVSPLSSPSFSCKALRVSLFFSQKQFPLFSIPFPPLSLFYNTCITVTLPSLCVHPFYVFSFSLCLVWPGHFKLNIYRPIYLLAVPCWFKYWQRFVVSSHMRSGHWSRGGGENNWKEKKVLKKR